MTLITRLFVVERCVPNVLFVRLEEPMSIFLNLLLGGKNIMNLTYLVFVLTT